MKKKMFLATIISMLGLVGCSQVSEDTSTTKVLENSSTTQLVDNIKPTEITFWHAMKGSNGEAIDRIVNSYNETQGKEKGIKVTAVFQDTKIASKVKLASSTKDMENAPDVIQTVGSDIPGISALPEIIPASHIFEQKNNTLKQDDFYPHLLRAFTYEKNVIGVPMNASTLLLYSNMNALKSVGVTEPPKTIDELAEVTKKLKSMDGKNGFNSEIARYQLVNFVVSQSDKNFVGDNEGGRASRMTKYVMGEDGSLDKFLTEWQKVIETGNYKFTEDNANEEFSTGLNSMVLLSSARLGAIKKLVGDSFEWKTSFIPKVSKNDTSGASIGGSSLVLYSHDDANRLSAAWDFISYATSPKVQAEWSKATGYIPVNINTEKLPEMMKFYEENPNYKVALEQMKNASPMSQEPFDLVNWEVNDIIKDVMKRFAQGNISKDEAKDEIIKKSNDALSEYNRVNN